MPTIKERVEEWQTTITGLQSTIAELSQKLAAVEGRPESDQQVQILTEQVTTLQTELAELKAAKPSSISEPEAPEAPKPPSRKSKLASKLRQKSAGGDRPEVEPKHREPRRKLGLI